MIVFLQCSAYLSSQTKLRLDMSNSNSMILLSAPLEYQPLCIYVSLLQCWSERSDQISRYVKLQFYLVAARVDVMLCPLTWLSGIGVPGFVDSSSAGWSGVWQSPCWNSRNSRIQQFLKPFDQLHRFWFENLSDINPLAKILNPSQILWSYYWPRPCYGLYHWAHQILLCSSPMSVGWCNKRPKS